MPMRCSAASTLTVAEHGSGARDEDETERRAEDETAAEVAARPRLSRANGASIAMPNRGTSSVAATTKSSAIAMSRSVSCGSPSAESSADADSVNTVKLTSSPATIAYGRRVPPAAPPASTIGSTGNTHGDTAVITPATNPMASSRITRSSSSPLYGQRITRGLTSPLTRHIVLLRGINIGPRNRIAMPELRTALEAAGFADVETYVQSGNVVVASGAKPAEVARACEDMIAAQFGLEIDVVVRTRAELASVVRRDPLGDVASDPKRYQVTFLDATLAPAIAEKITAAPIGGERVVVAKREIYAWHPDGVGRSKLAALLGGRVARRHGNVAELDDSHDAARARVRLNPC